MYFLSKEDSAISSKNKFPHSMLALPLLLPVKRRKWRGGQGLNIESG